jgi:prepilin-type N-terminal cleavage/methylation domain-containing protein
MAFPMKNKGGMTLIEMIVAIGIFSIGMVGFTVLFSRTWQNNSYTLEMGQTSMAVSQGVSKIVNYVRGARQSDNGAYAIKSANDNDLVIYSDYDKDDITERLHIYLSNSTVFMGVTDPTSGMPKTYPSGDQETITLASRIVNNSTTPIFYYFNKDYPGDTVNNPLDTPASVSEIRLVKIYIQMNIDPNRAPDNIQLQSFAELRNLNDYN